MPIRAVCNLFYRAVWGPKPGRDLNTSLHTDLALPGEAALVCVLLRIHIRVLITDHLSSARLLTAPYLNIDHIMFNDDSCHDITS